MKVQFICLAHKSKKENNKLWCYNFLLVILLVGAPDLVTAASTLSKTLKICSASDFT
jgi:hypothetical protein